MNTDLVLQCCLFGEMYKIDLEGAKAKVLYDGNGWYELLPTGSLKVRYGISLYLTHERHKLINESRCKLIWKCHIIKEIIGKDVYEYVCAMIIRCPWPHKLLCY